MSNKLEAAKAYLGDRWVSHPDYKYTPRHSNEVDSYVQARQPYLRAIAQQARRDRLLNPAFQRAEYIRRIRSTL